MYLCIYVFFGETHKSSAIRHDPHYRCTCNITLMQPDNKTM